MRESPSVALMEILREHGAQLSYADPHVPVFPPMREHCFDLSASPITSEVLAAQDAVIVATNHDAFDYDLIKEQSRLIIDSRGVYRQAAEHIVRA
jgi:UDP-N-acetyl-D-glucosamine dehydrogenase